MRKLFVKVVSLHAAQQNRPQTDNTEPELTQIRLGAHPCGCCDSLQFHHFTIMAMVLTHWLLRRSGCQRLQPSPIEVQVAVT